MVEIQRAQNDEGGDEEDDVEDKAGRGGGEEDRDWMDKDDDGGDCDCEEQLEGED